MKTRVFGIKTIKINNTPVHTINVIINSNPTIMSRIINDEFWKTRHTIYMHNGKSKITFLHTTTDMNEASVGARSLIKILFAHKMSNLFNDSFLNTKDKVNLINEVILEETKPTLFYEI